MAPPTDISSVVAVFGSNNNDIPPGFEGRTNQIVYQCRFCPRYFYKQQAYAGHNKAHVAHTRGSQRRVRARRGIAVRAERICDENGTQYKCPVCLKLFQNRYSFSSHCKAHKVGRHEAEARPSGLANLAPGTRVRIGSAPSTDLTLPVPTSQYELSGGPKKVAPPHLRKPEHALPREMPLDPSYVPQVTYELVIIPPRRLD